MERLTYRSGEYWEVKGADGTPCDEVCENRFLSGCHDCQIQTAFDRLAAYEDTGLEPGDIDALKKREQGLAELLVQVSCGCAVSYTRLEELAQAEKDGRLVVLPCKVGDTVIDVKEIGKTVFLTREEAEAALKEREEADDKA